MTKRTRWTIAASALVILSAAMILKTHDSGSGASSQSIPSAVEQSADSTTIRDALTGKAMKPTHHTQSHPDSLIDSDSDNDVSTTRTESDEGMPTTEPRVKQAKQPPDADAGEETLARYGYPNISMKKRPMLKKREEIMKAIEAKDKRRFTVKHYEHFIRTTPN